MAASRSSARWSDPQKTTQDSRRAATSPAIEGPTIAAQATLSRTGAGTGAASTSGRMRRLPVRVGVDALGDREHGLAWAQEPGELLARPPDADRVHAAQHHLGVLERRLGLLELERPHARRAARVRGRDARPSRATSR